MEIGEEAARNTTTDILRYSTAIVNLFLSIVQFLMSLVIIVSGISTYFRSLWSYFDLIYIVLNTLISLSILIESFISTEDLRVLESILAIVVLVKLLYYLRLVD